MPSHSGVYVGDAFCETCQGLGDSIGMANNGGSQGGKREQWHCGTMEKMTALRMKGGASGT